MSEEWVEIKVASLLSSSIGGVWGEETGRSDVDVRVYRSTDFNSDGRLSVEKGALRSITGGQLASRKLEQGDILLEKSGGGPNQPVGRVVFVSEPVHRNSVCANFVQLLRPDTSVIVPKFLFYLLWNAHNSNVTLEYQAQTTGIRNLRTKDYLERIVSVPSLPVQRRIVDLMTHLDAHIANLLAEREAASATRDALAESHFSSGSGSRYLVGDLLSIKTGKLDVNQGSDDGEYPFFTCSRVVHRIDWAEFYGEAVIIAGNGDLNVRYFEGDFNAYQRTYVLQNLDGVECNLKYLYLFFDFYVSTLRSNSSGSVIKYIKLGDLRDALVPLPTSQEQQEFVSIIFSADEVIGTLDQEIAAMASLRVRLLDNLLRGTDSILSQYDMILEQVA